LESCTAAFSDMSIMLIRTLHPIPSQLEPQRTPAGERP
jgi:cobalt-precorrin-7 (C5)-methyltransferase